jgi:hypothetical protein
MFISTPCHDFPYFECVYIRLGMNAENALERALNDILNRLELRKRNSAFGANHLWSDPLLFCVLRCQAIRSHWWPTNGWPRTRQTARVQRPSCAKSTESKTAADQGLAVSLARIFWTHEKSGWVGDLSDTRPLRLATEFSPLARSAMRPFLYILSKRACLGYFIVCVLSLWFFGWFLDKHTRAFSFTSDYQQTFCSLLHSNKIPTQLDNCS